VPGLQPVCKGIKEKVMDKTTFLNAYILLENTPLGKDEKRRRTAALFATVDFVFDAEDVFETIKSLKAQNITIRHELFKLLYPVLEEGYAQNNLTALKALIALGSDINHHRQFTKDTVYITDQLIEKALALEPADPWLLSLLEEDKRRYIEYTLHEWPDGVLYGWDGASINEMQRLLELTDEYEALCQKLGLDNSALIAHTRNSYTQYLDYLTHRTDYKNFRDYLQQHK
jgi:hypothetical protein